MESLPKLDRDVYRAEMRVELEHVLQEVMDAVDEAPAGTGDSGQRREGTGRLGSFPTDGLREGVAVENRCGRSRFPRSGQQHDRKALPAEGPARSIRC